MLTCESAKYRARPMATMNLRTTSKDYGARFEGGLEAKVALRSHARPCSIRKLHKHYNVGSSSSDVPRAHMSMTNVRTDVR